MATREWDNTNPPNSQNFNLGATRIRETREDVDERLSVDHYNSVNKTYDGEHRKTTLRDQGSRPSTEASKSKIWAENSGGVSQPYMKDGGGNVRQLGVPVGAIMAYLPGYFTAAGNVGYTGVAMTLPDGYVLCDGSAPNDANSPIWNLATRYVPDLDDARFLMGNTVGNRGTTGGANDAMAHTHGFTQPNNHSNHAFTQPSAHSITQPTFTYPAHKHEIGGIGGNNFWMYDSAGVQETIGYNSAVQGSGSTSSGVFSTATETIYSRTDGSGSCTRTTDVALTNNHSGGAVDAHSAHSGGAVGTVSESRTNQNLPLYINVSYIIKIK